MYKKPFILHQKLYQLPIASMQIANRGIREPLKVQESFRIVCIPHCLLKLKYTMKFEHRPLAPLYAYNVVK